MNTEKGPRGCLALGRESRESRPAPRFQLGRGASVASCVSCDLPYLPRANWSTSRPVIQLTEGGARGGGWRPAPEYSFAKYVRLRAQLYALPLWSQHRTGPLAWHSLERRKERAGALREGFLEEGVGFRWAEGRAEPWQTQGLGRSLLPSRSSPLRRGAQVSPAPVEGLWPPRPFAPRAGALRGRFWQSPASLQLVISGQTSS